MVYRGIRCRIPNEHGQILGDLLKPVDLAKYVWKLGNSEAYFIKLKGQFEDFFTNDDYEQAIVGANLEKRFDQELYYTIFVDLQGYPSERFTAITTYEDFVRSDCEIVILLTDSTYLDIYCKDLYLLKELYLHAKNMQFEDLHFLTNENDNRTKMVAF